MFNKTYTTIIFLFFLALLSSVVFCDGGMWHYQPHQPQYTSLAKETEQLAFISHENNYENLLVRVATDEKIGELTNLIWILPVPALPEDVVIGHIESIKLKDRYNTGTKLSDKAKDNLKEKRWWFYNSQIWPAPFYFLSGGGYMSTGMVKSAHMMDSLGSSNERYAPQGITIHETHEKYGLTSQLITAEDGTSLYNFLDSKGLDMPVTSRKILNYYVGGDFSFVITEITDKKQFSGSAAVYTTFPSKALYYPLVLTSVYESHRIPTKIYVDGYVNPKIYSKIKQYTEVNYYVDGKVKPTITSDEDDLFRGASFEKYTLITMNPPSKYLQKDLIISKVPPLSITGYNFVYEHLFLSCIILFLLISCISSLAVALIFKKDKKTYLKTGLFNVFSIIGYFVALNKFSKDDKDTKEIKVLSKSVFFANCIVCAIVLAFLLFVFSLTISAGAPPFYDPIAFLFFISLYIIPLSILYSTWKTHTTATKLLKELAPDKLDTIKIGLFGEVLLFSVIFMMLCLLFFTLL